MPVFHALRSSLSTLPRVGLATLLLASSGQLLAKDWGVTAAYGTDSTNKVGIIAAVCVLLSEQNVNILDISQTLFQESFTMIMQVDMTQSSAPFETLSERLTQLGTDMDLTIRIQREEIFNAMHRI